MLTNLGIDTYFTGIFGSILNRSHKVEVIKACLQAMSISTTNAIIVGDTKFDIIRGKQAGIETFGVTWGCQEDLQTSGADYIVNNPYEILNLVQTM